MYAEAIMFKLVFFILAFFLISYIITMQVMRKKTMSLSNVADNEVIGTVDVYHVEGLPIPEGAQATINIYKHWLVINDQYRIKIDDIIDARLSLEKNPQPVINGFAGFGRKNFINATGLITITYTTEENAKEHVIFRQHRFDVEKRGLTGFYHILSHLSPNITTEEVYFE